jgi:hypothetical protein
MFYCVYRGVGRAFDEDERPTSNIQRPTSNEKQTGKLEGLKAAKPDDRGRLVKQEAKRMGKTVAFGFRIAELGKCY